jgi:hypothetical protein
MRHAGKRAAARKIEPERAGRRCKRPFGNSKSAPGKLFFKFVDTTARALTATGFKKSTEIKPLGAAPLRVANVEFMQSPYGAQIAQTALQSAGMSTRNFGGPFMGPPGIRRGGINHIHKGNQSGYHAGNRTPACPQHIPPL